jgi:hypothetical protein
MSENCLNHPDTPGAPCATCHKRYCDKCTYGSIDGFVCADCWSKQRARRLRRGVAIGVGAFVLAGVGIAGIALTTAHDSQPLPKTAAPKPDASTDLADAYREHLHQSPCNAQVEHDLIEYLLEKDRYKEVTTDGYRYLGQCGEYGYGQLIWKIGYAHQQLEQWIPDALLDAQLVIAESDDSDYWWWRGEAWSHGGFPDLAMADFRQSIALSSAADAAGFATGRIGDAAEPAKRPCEAARAWRLYRRGFSGEVDQSGLDEEARLSLTGHCDAEDGTGKATVPLDDTGRGKATVVVGTASGAFLVDPFAGTTILSSAFAAKAGVASSSVQRGEGMYSGIRTAGAPAVAPAIAIGKAHAAQVDVLIVPDLPAGIDGVIGLSFAWHFDVVREEKSMQFAAPAP